MFGCTKCTSRTSTQRIPEMTVSPSSMFGWAEEVIKVASHHHFNAEPGVPDQCDNKGCLCPLRSSPQGLFFFSSAFNCSSVSVAADRIFERGHWAESRYNFKYRNGKTVGEFDEKQEKHKRRLEELPFKSNTQCHPTTFVSILILPSLHQWPPWWCPRSLSWRFPRAQDFSQVKKTTSQPQQ